MLIRRTAAVLVALVLGGAIFAATPSVARAAVAKCRGVQVPAGASLSRVMSRHPPGTTYCLAAGRFRITAPIETDDGDRVIGAGRNATFIDGSGLPTTAEGIFLAETGSYFAHLDIFGAPTPTVNSGVRCSPEPRCGRAFSLRGSSLRLHAIDCHHNGGNCVGGGGSSRVVVNRLNCWKNGSPYSMIESFRYAACIKRAAAYDPGNKTIVRDSYVHDNPWVGLWCDHCKYGLFLVEDNRIIHNGANGIQWEMSGGWTSSDRAIVRNNAIRRNNYLEAVSFRGGVGISTANDAIVELNTFGGNQAAGVNVIFTSSRQPPQPDSRGVVIRRNTTNDGIRGCSLAGVRCRNNG